jgi:hypothetical protein
MKKRFAKLTREEKERVEARYHAMKPGEFDALMSKAKRHSPNAIRLPPQLVQTLKTVAQSEGEAEYQAMVRRWIEERLRQETSAQRLR